MLAAVVAAATLVALRLPAGFLGMSRGTTHMDYVSRGDSKCRWGPQKPLRVTVDAAPR